MLGRRWFLIEKKQFKLVCVFCYKSDVEGDPTGLVHLKTTPPTILKGGKLPRSKIRTHIFYYQHTIYMTATADPSSPSVGASHHMVFIYMAYNEIHCILPTKCRF